MSITAIIFEYFFEIEVAKHARLEKIVNVCGNKSIEMKTRINLKPNLTCNYLNLNRLRNLSPAKLLSGIELNLITTAVWDSVLLLNC